MEPRDDSDLPEQRVAMVLFATVRAIDRQDAAAITRVAVMRALSRQDGARTRRPFTVMCPHRDGDIRVVVHDAVELGMAHGNGYVNIQPTHRGFFTAEEIAERRGESDGG